MQTFEESLVGCRITHVDDVDDTLFLTLEDGRCIRAENVEDVANVDRVNYKMQAHFAMYMRCGIGPHYGWRDMDACGSPTPEDWATAAAANWRLSNPLSPSVAAQ